MGKDILRQFRRSIVLTWVCLLSALSAKGQIRQARQFSIEQGLPQSTVYCMMQDRQGFLWVGTGGGLARFDGYNFQNFLHKPGDPATIPDNGIRGLAQDKAGNIWIGTEKGLCVYDSRTGKIRACRLPQPAEGNWVYMPGRFQQYITINVSNTQTYQLKPGDQGAEPVIQKMASPAWVNVTGDTLGYLYGHVGHVLHVRDPQGNFTQYPLGSSGNQVIRLLSSPRATALITTTGGIYRIDAKRRSLTQVLRSFSDKLNIRSCFEDSRGNYWLAAKDKGVLLISPQEKLLATYTSESLNGLGKGPEMTTLFFEDRQGTIWAGTDGGGILSFPYYRKFFQSPCAMDGSGIRKLFIRAIAEDESGRIWLGALNDGLVSLDENGCISRTIPLPPFPDPENVIGCLAQGSTPGTLVAGLFGGAYTFDLATMKWGPPLHPRLAGPGKRTLSVCRHTDGHYWIANDSGLFVLSPETDQLSAVLQTGGGNVHICPGPKGSMLFTCKRKGVYLVQDKPPYRPILLPIPRQSAASVKFLSALADKKGNIWLATSQGLLAFDDQGKFLIAYGLNDGLPDLFLYGLLEDKKGRIWMSTNRGLACLDPRTGKIFSYASEAGLATLEYNSGAFLKTRNGDLIFGGIDGYVRFRPEDIEPLPPLMRPVLTSIKLFDEPLQLDTLPHQLHTLELPWHKNTLSFDVAALDAGNAEAQQYAFMLDGLDKDWYLTGRKHTVRYPGLPPGEYRLLVKTGTAEGAWSNSYQLINLVIRPPFWQSWWFYSLAGLSALGSVSGAVYWASNRRYRRQKARWEQDRAIEDVRRRISRDIHDDIGSDLTRIAVLADRLKSRMPADTDDIILTRLSQESRELVGSLGEIVWAVNPVHDTLSSLMAYLRQYTHKQLEDCPLDYDLQFPEEVPDLILNPELRRNIFLVYKESLNNIIKHAGATYISITIQLQQRTLHLTIADNGRGLPPDISTLGNGLQNMRKRMQEVGGVVNFKESIGGGLTTHFQVDMF